MSLMDKLVAICKGLHGFNSCTNPTPGMRNDNNYNFKTWTSGTCVAAASSSRAYINCLRRFWQSELAKHANMPPIAKMFGLLRCAFLQLLLNIKQAQRHIYTTLITHIYTDCTHACMRTLHYVRLHYITYVALICVNLHYFTLHYLTLHCIALQYNTIHYIALHSVQHYRTLRYITLHYITLHSVQQYRTLHYVTFIHPSVYTEILCHTIYHQSITYLPVAHIHIVTSLLNMFPRQNVSNATFVTFCRKLLGRSSQAN